MTSAYLLAAWLVCWSGATEAARRVIIEVENVSQPHRYLGSPGPTTAPTVFPLVVAMHDGTLDFLDQGTTASDELALLATEGLALPIIEAARGSHPDAVINLITNNYFGNDNPFDFESYAAREQNADPLSHRYFSFVGKLGPSDDAFVGNDDPKRFELFDETGRYLGPLVIEVYGSDVFDAGVRQNSETDLAYLDRYPDTSSTAADVRNESGVVSHHPGYNGSVNNPDGLPIGVLGVPGDVCEEVESQRYCMDIDAESGDFKRPGYLLAIIRLSSGLDASFSSFWYDPERAGEGFNVSIFDGTPTRMGVAWYTYTPDGSGEQIFLVGTGDVDFQSAEIELFRTRGGDFASIENPANVINESWGTIQIGFGGCDRGRVIYSPSDPQFTAGDYFISRIASAPAPLARNCGFETLGLVNDPDDDWPDPETGTVIPDPGPNL